MDVGKRSIPLIRVSATPFCRTGPIIQHDRISRQEPSGLKLSPRRRYGGTGMLTWFWRCLFLLRCKHNYPKALFSHTLVTLRLSVVVRVRVGDRLWGEFGVNKHRACMLAIDCAQGPREPPYPPSAVLLLGRWECRWDVDAGADADANAEESRTRV